LLDKLRTSYEAADFGPLEHLVEDIETNVGKAPKRNYTVEGRVPIMPRSLYFTARRSYILGEYIGSFLLSSMAIETAMRHLIGEYFFDKTQKRLTEFLNDLDFRKAITLLRELGLVKECLCKELHEHYNKRNWYSHLHFSSILGKDGEMELEIRDEEGQLRGKEKLKDNEFLVQVVVERIAAEKHALEALDFALKAFSEMFPSI
jgi:hypothetical protein